MKPCVFCGAEMENTAQFCPACGKAAEAVSVDSPSEDGSVGVENDAVSEPASESEGKIGLKEKLTAFFRKQKKLLIPMIAVLAVAVVAIVTVPLVTNTYMTPIRILTKYENIKTVQKEQYTLDHLNGFCKSEVKAVFRTLMKSDEFSEYALIDFPETWEEFEESYVDRYGADYKIVLTVNGKEPLEDADLRDFRSDVRDMKKELLSEADYTEDYDSDDWQDLADDLDMTKSEAKAYVNAWAALGEAFGDVKVTKGYELDITRTITGEELDEPKEIDETLRVYKLNGHWISVSALNEIWYLDYM